MVAKKKNPRGTSACCEAPCWIKKGVPRRTNPARKPWLLLRRIDSEENINPTVAKAKSMETTAGTTRVSWPMCAQQRAIAAGISRG